TVTNYVTFSSSSANFTTALQQSGNQVLHAGNYNDYAPTKTGGNASGTWAINISGNAATATTASNSTNLGGNAASYYDHRAYNVANNYLGAYYVGDGGEKPNNAIFGAGKLKIAMLSSGNLGFGGPWNDVIWLSTYTGGDVKNSYAIACDKYNDEIYFSRQAYDSASWGTGRRLLHSGNYTSGFFKTINGTAITGTGDITVSGSDATKLPLTGGTVTGNTVFTTSLTANTGITVNSASGSGYGINLYSGSSASPTYGLFFAQTGNFGTYGAVSADWATYFTMNSTANRGWIFREVESLGNVAAISNQGNMTLRSHFEQGNNIARPNVSWSAGSTSTGMVIFYLPGTTSNYGMVHMVFDIYEYNGNAASTVIVGGHNWSTSWYNTSVNVIGSCAKSVRLGFKDNRFCVVFGTSGSTWEYGTIVLRKIHNGSFYDNTMDMVGNWSATQTTTESFTSITGDLRALRTPAQMEVSGILYGYNSVRSNIFYDTDNTGYYSDPQGSSRLNVINCGDVYNDLGGWFRNYGATGIYNQSYGNHFYSDSGNYWNVSLGGNSNGGIRFRDNHAGTVRGYVYTDTSNNIGFLNAGGSWRARVVGGDYFLVEGSSARAPIFYDSNDTGYYADFASTSRTYRMGAYYFQWNGSVSDDHPFGLYFDSGLSSSYAIYRESGSWTYPYPDLRIAFHTGIKIGANPSYQGVRFYTDYDMSSQVMSVNNGSDPLGGGNVYVNSALQAGGSLRAPIFYDANNTGYYIDPAASTSIRTVGAWRSDSDAWDGEFSGKIQYHSSIWYFQAATGWQFRNSAGSQMMFCDSSGNVTFNGNVTAYSDRRLKSNITSLGSVSKYLSMIDAKRFTWNESGKADIGFIAQDVEEAGLPEFVLETSSYDPNTETHSETVKSLDYGRMVAVLWQAVKEQQSQIEAALAEVKSLKERLQ
ncbi:tail fiber domain-containing protein, partial [bacterium]|nr:tail fiber domain-containing protein [bacterium]